MGASEESKLSVLEGLCGGSCRMGLMSVIFICQCTSSLPQVLYTSEEAWSWTGVGRAT